MSDSVTHPKGEQQDGALIPVSGPVALDTFGGRIHVEWNPEAAVTPLGQLPFFIDYLKLGGLFDAWVESCPLQWTSPNAPLTSKMGSGLAVQHWRSPGAEKAWRTHINHLGRAGPWRSARLTVL